MNGNPGPLLHVVVETADEESAFVSSQAFECAPAHVRLYSKSTADEVAYVVATLATYGLDRRKDSIEGVLADFPSALPGGLATKDRDLSVPPSCCCGLESWRDWLGLLEGKPSPWLGHDPAPWVQVDGNEYCVWSDGGFAQAPSAPGIRFTRRQLESALIGVEADLHGFLEPLRAWLVQREEPMELVTAFVAAFSDNFVDPPKTNRRSKKRSAR